MSGPTRRPATPPSPTRRSSRSTRRWPGTHRSDGADAGVIAADRVCAAAADAPVVDLVHVRALAVRAEGGPAARAAVAGARHVRRPRVDHARGVLDRRRSATGVPP